MARTAPHRTAIALLLALLLGLYPALEQDGQAAPGGGGSSFWSVDADLPDIARPEGHVLDALAQRQAAPTLLPVGPAASAPRVPPPASARSVSFLTHTTSTHLALLTNVLLLDGA